MVSARDVREVERLAFAAAEVKSLAWVGDELVDVAGGWRRFLPDGTVTDPRVFYAFVFDRAMGAPTGTYAVLYTVLGTKGLVLKNGELVREINRSYYCADSYEYPIALGRLGNGRDVIAHCPEAYNRIEIEELESGRRLTQRDSESADFFHSRLQIEEAIREPRSLDGRGLLEGYEIANAEVEAAVFLDSDTILVTTSFDDEVLDREADATSLNPTEAGVWSLRDSAWVTRTGLAERTGTVMSLGGPFLGFYEHPRLFDPGDGSVVLRWEDLFSGRQTSSIILDEAKQALPPLALDPFRHRFAVAGDDTVTVGQLAPAE